MLTLPSFSPAICFDRAIQAATNYLKEAVPLRLWSETRYEGTDEVYLAVAHDKAYGKAPGLTFSWSDPCGTAGVRSAGGRHPQLDLTRGTSTGRTAP